jgi:hypothetical protein
MDGGNTVSAVIPKMAREVMDVFVEPLMKQWESPEKSVTDDFRNIRTHNVAEENISSFTEQD